jgi:hypothetical protein
MELEVVMPTVMVAIMDHLENVRVIVVNSVIDVISNVGVGQ